MNTEKTFNHHITQLMMRHECVIVPGLGGFITFKQSAEIKNNRIYPPVLSVRFNSLLNHNDGLLCEMYMTFNKLSYQQALEEIDHTVQHIFSILKTESKYTIEGIGDLIAHRDGSISIECQNTSFKPANYGLKPIILSPIQKRQQKKGTIVLQLPRTPHQTLKYAAAIFILSLITLLTPTNTNINEFQATLAFDTMKKIENFGIINQSQKNLATNTTLPAPTKQTTESPNIQAKQTSTEGQDLTQKKQSQNYHIIIASLTSYEQAQRYISEQRQYKTEALQIIHEKDKYRISLCSFATYKEAINQIDSIRQTKAGKNAWVMCKKHQ